MNTEKLKIIAKEIAVAGKMVSRDGVQKGRTVVACEIGEISLTSDSGYEAIYIGDTTPKSTNGYMCLYTNNTSTRNSFPSENTIVELLLAIINKEKLETGEGKAAYFEWEEFGGIDRQLTYFSEVVKRLAKI